MALDVGNKRIGVALSDELQILAHPLYTIHRKGIEKDIEEIIKKKEKAKDGFALDCLTELLYNI